MIHEGCLTKIKNNIKPYSPGYLAVINIASLKIKNDLMGYQEGDIDIQDLVAIIAKYSDNIPTEAKAKVTEFTGQPWHCVDLKVSKQ